MNYRRELIYINPFLWDEDNMIDFNQRLEVMLGNPIRPNEEINEYRNKITKRYKKELMTELQLLDLNSKTKRACLLYAFYTEPDEIKRLIELTPRAELDEMTVIGESFESFLLKNKTPRNQIFGRKLQMTAQWMKEIK